MGYDFTKGATKSSIIKEIAADWEDSGFKAVCRKKRVVGSVLWAVWEYYPKVYTEGWADEVANRTSRLIISCSLLSSQKDFGWGYKTMEEVMHPFQYSCPLDFLEGVPVASEGWRNNVRLYHRKQDQAKALSVGQIVSLTEGCRVPAVKITSLKPLRGYCNGVTYRLNADIIGEVMG